MPTNVVKTKKDEAKWKKAEEIAAKAGQEGNYAYIMGIYKRMNPDYKFKKTASNNRDLKVLAEDIYFDFKMKGPKFRKSKAHNTDYFNVLHEISIGGIKTPEQLKVRMKNFSQPNLKIPEPVPHKNSNLEVFLKKTAMARRDINSSKMQKGDIVLMSMGPPTYIGKKNSSIYQRTKERLYRKFSPKLQGAYTHTGIYVGNGQIVEARGDGVRKVSLKKALRNIDGAMIVRPKTSARKRAGAAKFALQQVGKSYEDELFLGKQGIGLLIPKKMEKFINSKRDLYKAAKFTCANLVAGAYLSQGFNPRSRGSDWSMTVSGDFLNDRKNKKVKTLGKASNSEAIIGRIAMLSKVAAEAKEPLIGPPPSESERVKELAKITSDRSRYTKNKVLDKKLDDNFILFSEVLGIPKKVLEKFCFELSKVIHHHKMHFNIDRPHKLAAKHGIPFDHDYKELSSAHTKSYPSGHACQAHYMAITFSKMYPKLKSKLMSISEQVGQSRIDRGVHFPSDVAAGKKLAEEFYKMSSKDLTKEAAIATKTDPAKWEQAKRDAKARMGGKHSARAMQLATQLYKKRGGGYSGAKPSAKSNSLKKWGKQDWGYSGKDKPGQGGSGVYLPKAKRDRLKSTEEGRKKLQIASKKKATATREGRQYSSHGLAAGTSLSKKASSKSLRDMILKAFKVEGGALGMKALVKHTKSYPKIEMLQELKKMKQEGLVKDHPHGDMYTDLQKKASVEYRGHTFPGYNVPVKSDRPNKKKMVLVKKGDKVKLIHFGHSSYKHNYSKKAKSNYLTRSAGIRNKEGKLTKNDPFSPNYWSRKVLWPKGQKADGSSLKKKASAPSDRVVTLPLVKSASFLGKARAGLKNLYTKAQTNPISIGMAQGAGGGLGGLIGGSIKGAGRGLTLTSAPGSVSSKIGKGMQTSGDLVGSTAGQLVMDRGGVVKKKTVAILAKDGDPEAVIPLGNDRADILNRRRVIKKALKVIQKEKQKTAGLVGGAIGTALGARKGEPYGRGAEGAAKGALGAGIGETAGLVLAAKPITDALRKGQSLKSINVPEALKKAGKLGVLGSIVGGTLGYQIATRGVGKPKEKKAMDKRISPVAKESMGKELKAIKKEKADPLVALPGVSAVGGAYLGYKNPDYFKPSAFFPRMKAGTKGAKVMSAALGAGTLATLGWLPAAMRDTYIEGKKIVGKK